jgi:tetratricopeptide (TPR) repeat protein
MKIREPYFLWIHFYDPHAPYLNGGYDGEIAFVDAQIGRLLKSLPTQNTLIAVAGDHGESLGEHGEWTHRIFVYDSTMRVPFWISGPGVPAQRVRGQARLIDFLPTVLSLLQVQAPQGLDGVALPAKAGQPAILESFFPQMQLGWSPLLAMRTAEWKYIEAPRAELYDLRIDPAERTNVIGKNPALAKKFRAQLPSAGAPAAAPPMDPETAEQLASLGYVGGGSAPGDGADPKDRIAIWNEIEKAVDLEKTDPAKTIAVLERARNSDPRNPMILTFLAEKYAAEGNLALADKVLTDLLRQDPDNTLALSRSANVRLRMGRAAEALRIAEQLLKAGAPGPEAHLIAAQASLNLNDLPLAENHLREALERDPGDPETRVDLGNLLLQRGNTGAAAEQFNRVLQKDARSVQALNGLATVAYMGKQYEECEARLQQAAKIDPGDPQTKMNRALLYTRTGRVGDAVAIYRQLIADPATPPDWKNEASARVKELVEK